MKIIHASESGHWYDRDGAPAYTVIGANGEERATTLRDARKLGLVPSVTTVMKCAANPGLELWKQNQVLLAALTLPKQDGEPEADWLKRVARDSKEHSFAAAERGTIIHAALERYYEFKVMETNWAVYQSNVAESIYQHFGELDFKPEKSFASPYGYGGKVDLSSANFGGVVIDFKTKEFGPDDKLKGFDENAVQLAAYRIGLGLPQARCANVFVSVSHPGHIQIVEWTPEQIDRGWEMFNSLLNYWIAKTGVQL